MSESVRTIKNVEIYMATMRWSGDMTIPASLRVSDFLNNDTRRFLNLIQATVVHLSDTIQNISYALEEVVINKSGVIAVVLRIEPARGHAIPSYRVPKTPHRVMLYAPPFCMSGDVYHTAVGRPIDTLEHQKNEFLVMTDVTLWQIAARTPLGTGIEFAAVNRQWIAAMHSLPQKERQQASSFWNVPRKPGG